MSTMSPPLSLSLFSSFLVQILFLTLPHLASSSSRLSLIKGSSLSVENPNDVITSPKGTFSAGFFPVGRDESFTILYAFTVWFSKPSCRYNDCTPVWMANRNNPTKGKRSELSLLPSGSLVLTDAGISTVWSSDTLSRSSVQLKLEENGNLVLANSSGDIIWQSFDSPTDTLLPTQALTRNTAVVSSRGNGNYSSGFYRLYFDHDNTLRLLYDGRSTSGLYWPYLWAVTSTRFFYSSSRNAVLDSLGHFTSSDKFEFYASDYGIVVQRRLTVDSDGVLRLYSRSGQEGSGSNWTVTYQSIPIPCFVRGVCGNNSLCSYDPYKGRSCSCVPGYKRVDPNDWSFGCEPNFNSVDLCNPRNAHFIRLLYSDFYGYDYNTTSDVTLEKCKEWCLNQCRCRGFQYSLDTNGVKYYCFLKMELVNGHNLPSLTGEFYLKVPKSVSFPQEVLERRTRYSSLSCPVAIDQTYPRKQDNALLIFMLRFALAVGGTEAMIVFFVWFIFCRNQEDITAANKSYFLAATGFNRFTYDELKKATKNFSFEIGRGTGGIVYKGMLPDGRMVAVKLLNDLTTGEADFLAEASTIGKVNHMNLIEMWGYCAEGKHRLLVYEYMEHGSLAENLSSPELDWKRRFDIAVGTAKGLAYLHEECLEWVLHCDVKPQNILLDTNYQPKVADFGLSKLVDRGKWKLNFSRIRGTRGYMAPEWVSNLPITSKVDVYSYGVVMLELVTGMNPASSVPSLENGGDTKHVDLVSWARKRMQRSDSKGLVSDSGLEQMIDPALNGNYDRKKMEVLIEVALQCVEEDKDARPTMSQVVEMLLWLEQEQDS